MFEALEQFCHTSLQTVTLTDLHNPLKKAAVEQLSCLMAACAKQNPAQILLSIERCTLSN